MKMTFLAAIAAFALIPATALADDVPTGSDAFSGSQQTITGGTIAGSALFGTSEAHSANFASTHGGSASGAHADDENTFTWASDHRTTVAFGGSESGAFGAAVAVAGEARSNYGEQFSSAHAETTEDDGWGGWWD